MTVFQRIRRPLIVALVVAAAIVAVLALRATRRGNAAPALVTAPVERRDIALTIEATGTVEPIDLVEVKSKASGQIVRMPVEVGSNVKDGDLLAQIDTRDVQNQYDQALATLRAAQAKVDISQAQKKRADDLFAQQVITTDEHESAELDFANSQAALVRARTDLDLARQRRDDATVRAPITGTVLEQLVSAGQVIASATSSVSGGTSLLKMADLSRIRVRGLVSETDIGNVRPGQPATVTVEAFPQRTFAGTVEKVEPQAVVQQSVTMFPVLISIGNQDRLLLPGMNGEISVLVERHDDVITVPLDAVRTVRELSVVAPALKLDPDSVKAQVERQIAIRMAERATRGFGSDSAGRDPARAAAYGADSARGREWRRGGGGDSTRGAWRGGQGGRRGGGRGTNGGGTGAGGDRTMQGGASGGMAGGSAGNAGAVGSGAGSAGRAVARAGRAQVVFVKTGNTLEPRVVRLGLSDFDYAEVMEGVKEGDQVVLLGVVEAQAMRQDTQNRMRQRMGSGVPGVPGGAGGTGGRGAGTGGGGTGGGGTGGGGAGRRPGG